MSTYKGNRARIWPIILSESWRLFFEVAFRRIGSEQPKMTKVT